MDVSIKDKSLRHIGVYTPNGRSQRPDFFRAASRCLTISGRVILTGDLNAVLDPEVDRIG